MNDNKPTVDIPIRSRYFEAVYIVSKDNKTSFNDFGFINHLGHYPNKAQLVSNIKTKEIGNVEGKTEEEVAELLKNINITILNIRELAQTDYVEYFSANPIQSLLDITKALNDELAKKNEELKALKGDTTTPA